MSKLSVIIPAWKEPYLNRTVDDIFKKATGDIEVIASLDGRLPVNMPKEDSRLKIIRHKSPGMRASINKGLAAASGDYIMKLDAHCMFSEGFDEELISNCAENWLLVPRRYSLNEVDWSVNTERPSWDYHYVSYPTGGRYDSGMAVVPWNRYKREKVLVDDTMIIQGSCWFANKNFFMKHVGFLDDRPETYGGFAGEQHEICFKYWLVAGGECKVIKQVWYAHLLKRLTHYRSKIFDRSRKKISNVPANYVWLTKHWFGNEEPNMIHNLEWLIDKFWPVPSWPESRALWNTMN